MTVDEFAQSDVAYLNGAMTPPERLGYEQHLRTCPSCAAELEESAKLVALLRTAPASAFGASLLTFPPASAGDDFETDAPGDDFGGNVVVPASLLPRMVAASRRERRRRRVVNFFSTTAAACLVAFVAIVLTRPGQPSNPNQPPPQALAMLNVVNAPIQAKAQVVTTDTWAQVNLWFTYNSNTYADGNFQAVARTKTGQTVIIGTWPGIPGQTSIIKTPTHLHTVDLSRIDIVSANGTTLSSLTI